MTSPDYVFQLNADEKIGDRTLHEGAYVVSKQNAAELLAMTENSHVDRFERCIRPLRTSPFDPSKDWNGKTILFVRAGGFGDLLAVTPTLHEIKKRWPKAQIWFATHERHAPAIQNNPDVDFILPWPLSVNDWNLADAHIWLDQSIEKQERSREIHFVDLAAQECGGIELEDKRMRYTVTEDEEVEALIDYPYDLDKYCGRIGVQIHSNALNRTYPITATKEILIDLHKKGWQILLFGDDRYVKDRGEPGVHCIVGKSFRHACAALSTCDVVLAPDSAMCHVAGALGIPTVALYGPFPCKLRTAYHPSVHAMQGRAPCAPCFFHARNMFGQFPEGCPTADKGYCQALESIAPKAIIKAIEKAVQG